MPPFQFPLHVFPPCDKLSQKKNKRGFVLVGFIAFWVICVAISVVLVNKFKRSGWWIFFTALFPVTLLLLLASGRKEGKGGYKRCPECRELIDYYANICSHCRADQYPEKNKNLLKKSEII
ncbi:MAG TPA: hypothetical protein DCX03_05065 [Bacteroidales bacterium]|nr:hypothetical protein [Bacteroidales bacterium]